MNEEIVTLFGSISRYWYDKGYIKYFLDRAKGKPVRLKVTSYGGDVAEAVAISSLLDEHGNVTVEFIGFNASAATWMAFGAKRIEMHEDGMWLAHKCSTSVEIYGNLNVNQLEEKIKELNNAKKNTEAIDLMVAKKYADRSGKTVKEVIRLMEEEKWMSADETKEWGFIDFVIPGVNKKAKLTDELTNCFQAKGLPIPVLGEIQEDKSVESIAEQVIKGIRNLFVPTKEQKEHKKLITMNKNFIFINQILNVEGLDEQNGKVSLDIEDLKRINEAFKKASDDLATAEKGKKTATDELNSLVDELDSLGEGVKQASGHKNKIEAIREVINNIPGVSADVHAEDNEDNKFADIATDPVNNYEYE